MWLGHVWRDWATSCEMKPNEIFGFTAEVGNNHLFPRISFLISKCPLIFKSNDFRSNIMFLKCVWHEVNRHWHQHISGEAREAPCAKALPVLPSAPTTLWLHELLTHNASRAQGKEFRFAVYHSSFFLPIVNSGLGLFFKFWQSESTFCFELISAHNPI